MSSFTLATMRNGGLLRLAENGSNGNAMQSISKGLFYMSMKTKISIMGHYPSNLWPYLRWLSRNLEKPRPEKIKLEFEPKKLIVTSIWASEGRLTMRFFDRSVIFNRGVYEK